MIKKEGFSFCFDENACKTCKGKCCIGEGYVFLTDEDIEGISNFLSLKKKEFLRLYTRKVNGRIALIDLVIKNEKRCVFLDDNYRCEIYPKRPKQCRDFPFWESLKDKSFDDVKKLCPGIAKCS